MPTLDVFNYFLVILGGFGVVWSFKHLAHRQYVHIGEFEYAAFSALWGIPVFLVFDSATHSIPQFMSIVLTYPMIGTLYVFPMGLVFGSVGAMVWNGLRRLWRSLRKLRAARS
jgi:ABC-type Co2+ transport system permease subunit